MVLFLLRGELFGGTCLSNRRTETAISSQAQQPPSHTRRHVGRSSAGSTVSAASILVSNACMSTSFCSVLAAGSCAGSGTGRSRLLGQSGSDSMSETGEGRHFDLREEAACQVWSNLVRAVDLTSEVGELGEGSRGRDPGLSGGWGRRGEAFQEGSGNVSDVDAEDVGRVDLCESDVEIHVLLARVANKDEPVVMLQISLRSSA